MSVSVDDLVASLSANHIGQEAMDLAILEAQLAQTLFTHPISLSSPHSHPPALVSVNINRRDPTGVQHCTTPTARTPSSTAFTWPLPIPDHVEHSRKRSASFARRPSDDGWCDLDEMDEERIVEDMVTPESPRSQNSYLWSPYSGEGHGSSTRLFSTPAPTPVSSSGISSPIDSSLFTSTDPFYLQASQSAQQSHPSFFAHVGRPSAHSPFMMGVSGWDR